ncbi:MAG TPA: VCBS repeat-containing protein, partial [Pyrinomonadaceae bacterium]|nr:VCBS repeat-containing protein [Pyrinomonadaceae bacterium]
TDLNTGTDNFPAPAPAAPYNFPPSIALGIFNGASPNGTWNLYAVDDTLFSPGSINSGWSLNITTDGAPQTFINPATISFNDIFTPAAPYGSVINVSGQTGVISDINVTLTGYSHTAAGDVDVLLVSPNGKNLILMSDIAGTASNINLTFDDAAPTSINSLVSGTYKPTDNLFDFDFFPPSAPLSPYLGNNAGLNNFNDFNPNGEWRFFVVDDAKNSAGSIPGGWSLDITTVPQPPPTPQSCSGASFIPSNFTAGANPTNLAVADFNNDSNADVAVVNQASNDVSILLGNGNGTLGAQVSFPAGNAPYSIVAGKFNADNNFDLADANTNSNNVSILLGNVNGTFSAPTNFPAGINPISIASADFNNDTKADLAIANFGGFFFGTVTILLGNGTGGFTAGTPVRTRTQPSFVAAANYNGDGNQDLIVTSFGADSVSTFSGVGNGTFLLRQNLTTNAGPVSIEVADFGTDGFLDFAVANYNSDNVRFYTGNSTGDFTSSGSQAVGTNPISVTSGDYTGTGTKTIATALSGGNSVTVLTSNVSVGLFPNAVETADFNNDGKPDMITANSGSNDVSVLLNSCLAAKGNLFDYNGDRKTDYSVFRSSNTSYFIQSLNSSGAFISFGRSNDTLVPADYTGDRRTEIAYYRPENGLWFVLDVIGNRRIYYKQFGLPEDIPAPADFDGDGKADLAVFRPSNGSWYFRRSSDNAEPIVQFGASGDKPVAADFDGDDKADIAVYRPSTGVWYILRSSDSQVFIRQFGIAEDKTVAGDYDGDGKADIAVWRPSSAVWYVLRSSDEGFDAVAW